MSEKNFALAYTPLMVLGFLGVWLGFQTDDPTDFRFWFGFIMVLGAVLGLIVVFRRDLRPTKQEKSIEWKRIESKGKLRFVLIQVLLSEVGMLPLLATDLFEVYQRDMSRASLQALSWLLIIAILVAVFSCLWAVMWWHSQERRYANAL